MGGREECCAIGYARQGVNGAHISANPLSLAMSNGASVAWTSLAIQQLALAGPALGYERCTARSCDVARPWGLRAVPRHAILFA